MTKEPLAVEAFWYVHQQVKPEFALIVDLFAVLALIFGLLQVTLLVTKAFMGLWRRLVRPLFQSSTRIYNNYGKEKTIQREKSWAVVTGGSDGIGFGMCKKLAGEGYNICIISRNEHKM
jgi:hypothetical protein